jgi:hypothetical protein
MAQLWIAFQDADPDAAYAFLAKATADAARMEAASSAASAAAAAARVSSRTAGVTSESVVEDGGRDGAAADRERSAAGFARGHGATAHRAGSAAGLAGGDVAAAAEGTLGRMRGSRTRRPSCLTRS